MTGCMSAVEEKILAADCWQSLAKSWRDEVSLTGQVSENQAKNYLGTTTFTTWNWIQEQFKAK